MAKRIALFFFIVFSSVATITAQTDTTNIVLASEDARCELNNRFIDALLIDAVDKNAQVFIVSRRSKNEKKGVNWARLFYARAVVSDFKGFTKEKMTLAVGETNGNKEGALEFWVGSKLFLISFISKNQQICLLTPTYGN